MEKECLREKIALAGSAEKAYWGNSSSTQTSRGNLKKKTFNQAFPVSGHIALDWANDMSEQKLYRLILHLIYVSRWPNINQATNQFQIVR